MKCGRCGADADADAGVVAATAAMLGKGAGVRGGGTLKRLVAEICAGRGVEGSNCCCWRDGELGGDVRRRLFGATVSKSISSSSSSCSSSSPLFSSCGLGSSNSAASTSIECMTPWRGLSSCASNGLDCDGSSMLSTRSSFLLGFGRGRCCTRVSSCVVPSLSPSLPCSGATGLCGGAMTKRFAGANFLNCNSGFGAGVLAEAGVCITGALRRLECGL